jgi:hypothetical protein
MSVTDTLTSFERQWRAASRNDQSFGRCGGGGGNNLGVSGCRSGEHDGRDVESAAQ